MGTRRSYDIPRAMRLRSVCGAALLALAGCAELAPYQAPVFGFPDRFSQAGTPVLARNDTWWTQLEDPALNTLIPIAFSQSVTLAQAQARVDEARALSRTIRSGPELTASAQGRVSPDASETLTNRFDLSWLFPIPEATRRAANGRIEVAEAERDAARLLLLAELSATQVDLRTAQTRLQLLQSDLRNRRRTLGLTRELADAGEVTRLQTIRSQARIAELEADLPGQRAAVDSLKNQIAVLAGQLPGQAPVALDPRPIPTPGLHPDVGIPADLLRNRPDIRVAERQYYVAVARIGEAERALYPTLSLGGTVSIDVFSANPGAVSSIFSPTLTLPVFPNGAATAQIEAQRAAARQAMLAWRASVLDAVLQVENALLDYQAAHAATRAAHRAVNLYSQALSLTRELFEAGEATLSDVIDAETALANARLDLARTQQSQALSFIDLNVQVGAGVEGDPVLTPPH